jgi:hypothetical protein
LARSTNAQDDLAQHVPRFHTPVRLRCVGEREWSGMGISNLIA